MSNKQNDILLEELKQQFDEQETVNNIPGMQEIVTKIQKAGFTLQGGLLQDIVDSRMDEEADFMPESLTE